jgi:CRP/FNR family cyclic AMP-dependent transcriptional regulator
VAQGAPLDAMLDRAIAASAILGLLSETARARLVSSGSRLTLERGGFLCRRGDPGEAIFVVVDGEIEISTNSLEGRQVRYASFGPGSVIGEMAALGGGVRSTDMTAATRSRVWRIPRVQLIEALKTEPSAAVALIAELADRLRRANEAIEATRTLDLGGRLAQLLLGITKDKPVVALTQTEIARQLTASREKVNRKLHAWASEGWIELARSGVRIVNRRALGSLAGDPSPR